MEIPKKLLVVVMMVLAVALFSGKAFAQVAIGDFSCDVLQGGGPDSFVVECDPGLKGNSTHKVQTPSGIVIFKCNCALPLLVLDDSGTPIKVLLDEFGDPVLDPATGEPIPVFLFMDPDTMETLVVDQNGNVLVDEFGVPLLPGDAVTLPVIFPAKTELNEKNFSCQTNLGLTFNTRSVVTKSGRSNLTCIINPLP